ncbi:hypothetical protein H4I96_11466 [Botrytis cinerea]
MPFQFLKSPLSYKRHTSAMVCRDQSFSKSDDTLIFTDVYEEDLFTKDPDCIRKITWTTTPRTTTQMPSAASGLEHSFEPITFFFPDPRPYPLPATSSVRDTQCMQWKKKIG